MQREQILTIEDGRKADKSLIASIETNGILNPLKVYLVEEMDDVLELLVYKGHAILDGYRRLDAADQLGITDIPIVLVDPPVSDNDRRLTQIILNRNRKDMKPSNVASAIMLLKEGSMSQKDIAKKFGLSEPEVSMYLTLHRGSEKIRKAIDSGRMSLSAAEPLLTKPLAVQEELADAAIRQRTVRAVRALVKTHLMKSDITAPASQLEEDIDPLEYLALEEMTDVVSTLERIKEMDIHSRTIFDQMTVQYKRIEDALENLYTKTVVTKDV